MDELQRLVATDSIRRTIAIYAQLLDSGRVEEWSQLFVEDARFRVYGETYAGRESIQQEIGGMQPPPDRPVKHVCLVPVIELVDDHRALAWTDFSAFGTSDAGKVEIATIGRYYDELLGDEGRWRFVSRTIVMAGDPVPDDVSPSPRH